jgi:hypothetical protein
MLILQKIALKRYACVEKGACHEGICHDNADAVFKNLAPPTG